MTDNNQTRYSLFLITIPGLENLAYSELIHKLELLKIPSNSAKIVDGGIEFEATHITQIQALHYYLKIPTKILLRINSFKAKDFPKLYNQLRKIQWKEYIPWVNPELVFSAHESKIFDERKVKKALEDAIKDENIAGAPKEKYKDQSWQQTPEVYIRIQNDEVLVSLNLTGERLDRRGIKTFSTKAPIRESIASAIYYASIGSLLKKNEVLEINLADLMSGSGTLLFEANEFYKKNNRDFNFTSIPLFKSAISQIRKDEVPIIHTAPVKIVLNIANDLDELAISAFENNQKNYQLENVKLSHSDYKTLTIKSDPNHLIIISNPPYNKRIKTTDDMDTFLFEYLNFLAKSNPKVFTIITPTTNQLPKIKNYELLEIKPVNNGGIKTKIAIYRAL